MQSKFTKQKKNLRGRGGGNTHSIRLTRVCYINITRNTLTQASKNGRKPYLFPQKKIVSVFYAINISNTIYNFKPTNFNCA